MSIQIKRPTVKVALCTDYSAREAYEAALADEVAAGTVKGVRMSTKTDAKTDALAAMQAATYTFTLEGLARSKYRELVAAHPPRDDHAGDQRNGVNIDTFGDPLIEASILTVVGPDGEPVDFDPVKDWGPLADEMTDAQWTEFFTAALQLNLSAPKVPRPRNSN